VIYYRGMKLEFEKIQKNIKEIREETERQKQAEIDRNNSEKLALEQKKLEQDKKDREEFVINEKIFREAGVVELLEKIRDEKLLVMYEICTSEKVKNRFGKETDKYKVIIESDPAEIKWSLNGDTIELLYNKECRGNDGEYYDYYSSLEFHLKKDKQISFEGLTDPEEITKEIAKIILKEQEKRNKDYKNTVDFVTE